MTHVQDYGHVSPGPQKASVVGRARSRPGAVIARSDMARVQDSGHVGSGHSDGP